MAKYITRLKAKTPASTLWSRVKAGEPVQVYSEMLSEFVWWVKDTALAAELKNQGLAEVIYTIDELRELAGKAPEFLKDIHQLKRQFGATLVKVTAEQKTNLPAANTPVEPHHRYTYNPPFVSFKEDPS